MPAREADGVDAPSRPSRFTRAQSARGGRTTAARRNRTEHPDDAEDRIAREIMRGGPREPTYREEQASWQREARSLGENPTEAEIEAVIGGWDAGQIGMLQRAREEVGLPRLRTDRESIATRRRDGADRSIRDEVADTRAGAARGRLLEQLTDADLDAVERDAKRENRDRGRGSNAPRDRAKRSAYEKRERIIRDVRNERERRAAASTDDDSEGAEPIPESVTTRSFGVHSGMVKQRDRRELNRQLDEQGVAELAPIRGVINNSRVERLAVARDAEGNIVGALAYGMDKQGKTVLIKDLRVNERRMGWGNQLLAAAARDARSQRNGEQYRMAVTGAVPDAKPFYERTGAEPFRDDHGFSEWTPEAVGRLAALGPDDSRVELPPRREREMRIGPDGYPLEDDQLPEEEPSPDPSSPDSSAPPPTSRSTTTTTSSPTSSTSSTTSGADSTTSPPTRPTGAERGRWHERVSDDAELIDKLRIAEPVTPIGPGPKPLLAGLQAAIADGRPRYTSGPFPPPRGTDLDVLDHPPASGGYVEATPDGQLIIHDGEGGTKPYDRRMVYGFADTTLKLGDDVDPVHGMAAVQLNRAYRRDAAELSDAQRNALSNYVDGSFSTINGSLRGTYPEYEGIPELISHLDSAFTWTLPDRAVVHRGVRDVDPEAPSFPQHSLVGKTLIDRGFLSTSSDARIAGRFKAPVDLEIHVPAGTPAVPINGAGITLRNADERELLLPRGLPLRVLSDERDEQTGKRRIVAEVDMSHPGGDTVTVSGPRERPSVEAVEAADSDAITRTTADDLGLVDGDRIEYHGNGPTQGVHPITQEQLPPRTGVVSRPDNGPVTVTFDDDGSSKIIGSVMRNWMRKLDAQAEPDPEPEPEPELPRDRHFDDVDIALQSAQRSGTLTEVARELTDGELREALAELADSGGSRLSTVNELRKERRQRNTNALLGRQADEVRPDAATRQAVVDRMDAEEMREVREVVARPNIARIVGPEMASETLAQLDAALADRGSDLDADTVLDRLAALPSINPEGAEPDRLMAAAMQYARYTGRPHYAGAVPDLSKFVLFDREPGPTSVSDGRWVRYNPDGTIEVFDGQNLAPMDERSVAINLRRASRYAARREVRVAAAAREPAPRTGDGASRSKDRGRTLAGGDAADHVDTSGLSEGMRAAAHRGLDAIARVHRVDNMPRIQTINAREGQSFAGGYAKNFAVLAHVGGAAGASADDVITLNPDKPRPALSFVHEYGHALDNHGLLPFAEDTFGSSIVAGRPESRDPQVRALSAAMTAMADSPTIAEITASRQQNPEYVDYLLAPYEQWARAYEQYIAVRSGDPVLLAELRDQQRYDATPGVIGMQWPDEEFEPIAAAIDGVLRSRGWMD